MSEEGRWRMSGEKETKLCGQMRHRTPCRVNLNNYNGTCPLVHDSSKMIEVNSEFEQAVLVELADIHAGIAKIMEKLNAIHSDVNEYGLPIPEPPARPGLRETMDWASSVVDTEPATPEKAEDGTPIILDPTALKPAAPQMDVWACPACTKPGTRAPLMDAKDPKKRPMYHCKECPCYFPGEQSLIQEPGRPVRKADFDDTGEGKVIRPLK